MKIVDNQVVYFPCCPDAVRNDISLAATRARINKGGVE
jgi:hypothetical protein